MRKPLPAKKCGANSQVPPKVSRASIIRSPRHPDRGRCFWSYRRQTRRANDKEVPLGNDNEDTRVSTRTMTDAAALESVPVPARIRHTGVGDLLSEAARLHAGKIAIRYLSGAAPGDPVRDVTFDEVWRRV